MRRFGVASRPGDRTASLSAPLQHPASLRVICGVTLHVLLSPAPGRSSVSQGADLWAKGQAILASCMTRLPPGRSRKCWRKSGRSSTVIGRGVSGFSRPTTTHDHEPRCCACSTISNGTAIAKRSAPPPVSGNGSHRLPATRLPSPSASADRLRGKLRRRGHGTERRAVFAPDLPRHRPVSRYGRSTDVGDLTRREPGGRTRAALAEAALCTRVTGPALPSAPRLDPQAARGLP